MAIKSQRKKLLKRKGKNYQSYILNINQDKNKKKNMKQIIRGIKIKRNENYKLKKWTKNKAQDIYKFV